MLDMLLAAGYAVKIQAWSRDCNGEITEYRATLRSGTDEECVGVGTSVKAAVKNLSSELQQQLKEELKYAQEKTNAMFCKLTSIGGSLQ